MPVPLTHPIPILIVDDEADLRNLLVEALSDQGFDAVGADGAEQALAEVDRRHYPVVFTDLNMPGGLSGLDLLRAIHERDARSVGILMTGYATTESAIQALKRGAYDAPADPVDPNAPERILPFSSDLPRNRLGFARWVTDPRNPLTARVAVNRVWKQHFGRGLVGTLNDFGAQGQLPDNPALLDWLAGEFIRSGWDLKALHKLIVQSATYQQASEGTPESVTKDPENRLLSRGPKHRLGAEQIRDQALAVSGLLSPEIGGRSVKPYQPPGVWEEAGTGKSYSQDHGDKLYRRSLYTFWRRTAPPPSMLSFDAVTREVCTANREVTSTPLQSLVLLNDTQFIEAARVLAESLWRDPNPDERLGRAFQRVLGRPPTSSENRILQQLFEEQRSYFRQKPEEATQLLKTGEKPVDASVPPVELAAATLVVSTLMNHDEFVMKR